MAASFEEAYWTEDSQYRKFDDYEAGLTALRGWHAGLWCLIGPHMPQVGRHVDVGCGHGVIVHELVEDGWDARGFDVSRWIIEAAQHHSPQLADRFVVGDLHDPPFAGDFDLITCFEVLEHVPDPVRALRALSERLRPGGRLIATTPNLRPLIPWRDAVAADPTHVNVHEPSWWRGALQRSGLCPVLVSTFITIPLVWRISPYLSLWIPLGRRTGPGVLVVAEKQRAGNG
jgi:SAM-dependent methyltransferase